MEHEFIITGLGGQGVLFLTKVLASMARENNLPFIGSEVHGMSQRGGSVVSHLRIGNFSGPLVREGRASVIFALEESEAYRNLSFIRHGGCIYVDTAGEKFPVEPFKEILEKRNVRSVIINATSIATELQSPPSANLILLGRFIAAEEGFTVDSVERAISKTGSPGVIEKNLQAFRRGLDL
ncbi:MAG: 2-oxoacid:acceptor oxidoreductase family protein [Candidatus Eremiobacterota bacterium]